MKEKFFKLNQFLVSAKKLYVLFPLLLAPIGTHADYFIDGEGKRQTFCEKILIALNKSKPTNEHRPCISEEILKLPGVSDPPWEKLDLLQHEDLAKKMITLNAVGSAEYFREQKTMPQMYPTPEYQQRALDGAKSLGAELFALKLSPELFGNRVMVTLRFKSEQCGWPLRLPPEPHGESTRVAWVTADLKEIATGPGMFDSRAARPVLYKGTLYLVRPYGTDQEVEVYVPRREHISKVCNITFSDNVNN